MPELGLGFSEGRACTCPYCHRNLIPKIESEEWISMIEPIYDGEEIIHKTGRMFDIVSYIVKCRNCTRYYSLLYSFTDDYSYYQLTGEEESIEVEELPQDLVDLTETNIRISGEIGHEFLGAKLNVELNFNKINNIFRGIIANMFYKER